MAGTSPPEARWPGSTCPPRCPPGRRGRRQSEINDFPDGGGRGEHELEISRICSQGGTTQLLGPRAGTSEPCRHLPPSWGSRPGSPRTACAPQVVHRAAVSSDQKKSRKPKEKMSSTFNRLSHPRLTGPELHAFLATARGSQCVGRLRDTSAALQLLQSVYVACNENLSSVHMGRMYLARELCGDDFWCGRRRRDRVCAGICLAYLVDEVHVLPLRAHVTKSGKGSKRYWLRAPVVEAAPRSLDLTSRPTQIAR